MTDAIFNNDSSELELNILSSIDTLSSATCSNESLMYASFFLEEQLPQVYESNQELFGNGFMTVLDRIDMEYSDLLEKFAKEKSFEKENTDRTDLILSLLNVIEMCMIKGFAEEREELFTKAMQTIRTLYTYQMEPTSSLSRLNQRMIRQKAIGMTIPIGLLLQKTES